MDSGFRKVTIEMSRISDYVSNLAFILKIKCVLYLFYDLAAGFFQRRGAQW